MKNDVMIDGPMLASGQSPRAKSGLVADLLAQLAIESVRYCHWKSNLNIHDVLTADTDLDLLIDRASIESFHRVLVRLGFKRMEPPPEKDVPSIASFYQYDPEAKKWVHVHAHYQLVVGNDLTRAYWLPLEKPLVDTAVAVGNIPIPRPELELIVFVIRCMLKLSTPRLLRRWQYRFSKGARTEVEFLRSRADSDRMAQDVGIHLPGVDACLIMACLTAIEEGSTTVRLLSLRAKLLRSLRGYRRFRRGAEPFVWAYRSARLRIRRGLIAEMATKKRFSSAGLVLALVGGDGAGKSTSVAGIYDWITGSIAAKRVHLGRPVRSIPTQLLDIAIRVVGLRNFVRASGVSDEVASRRWAGIRAYVWGLRRVCLARDRFLAYTSARRFAAAGGLAICDRFPLRSITSMDGPQLAVRGARHFEDPILRRLARWETALYDKIAPPDALVVLKLHPEIAVSRKIEEPADFVRARSTEIWNANWNGWSPFIVDASASKDVVQRAIQQYIWQMV